jgi:hypothetical protein
MPLLICSLHIRWFMKSLNLFKHLPSLMLNWREKIDGLQCSPANR